MIKSEETLKVYDYYQIIQKFSQITDCNFMNGWGVDNSKSKVNFEVAFSDYGTFQHEQDFVVIVSPNHEEYRVKTLKEIITIAHKKVWRDKEYYIFPLSDIVDYLISMNELPYERLIVKN
jgi:hypothetical protein